MKQFSLNRNFLSICSFPENVNFLTKGWFLVKKVKVICRVDCYNLCNRFVCDYAYFYYCSWLCSSLLSVCLRVNRLESLCELRFQAGFLPFYICISSRRKAKSVVHEKSVEEPYSRFFSSVVRFVLSLAVSKRAYASKTTCYYYNHQQQQ